MRSFPIADKTNRKIDASLEYTLALFRDVLRAPKNADVVLRRFHVAGFDAALVFLDGMANASTINLNILEPCLLAPAFEGAAAERAGWLSREVVAVSEAKETDQLDDAVASVLVGETVLLCDGCPNALMLETKGFPKRGVEQPVNETVIIGPHEGFNESVKTNLSLVRRILHSPRLVAEKLPIGKGVRTKGILLYLDGVANEQMLEEVRRRVKGVEVDFVMGSGELEQYIEDKPFSLIPQIVHTERPDRAASFLIEGLCVVLVDGSPIALAMPVTFSHLLHTPDASNMRFPYGTFIRIIALLGLLLTILLPGLYLALVTHHNQVLPLALMTSIYETQSRVPVPVFFELVFMSMAFDLINEAGSRMPQTLGQGLGVVSALVLGQAAVAADIVSPMLIIVVAVSGLGSLVVPEYGLSIGVRITQILFLLAAALGGLYGMLLLGLVLLAYLCQMTSLGVPFMAPVAPARMHNPDVLTRYPLWQQRVRNYLANPEQFVRMRGRARRWEGEK